MCDSKNTFKIVTYNIFDGRNTDKIINNILEFIKNGASIVCLQEVRQSFRNVEFTKLLVERLPKHFNSQYFLEGDASWFDYGLGMLWDATIFSSPKFHQLPFPLQSHLTFWNKMFYRVLGLEPKIIKRGALIGTFTLGRQQIRITNLHLDFQGGNSHRANQLKSLTDYLAKEEPIDQEIICGDFNTLGIFKKEQKINSLEKQLASEFQSVINEPYNSAIVQQLDYIFIKNLRVNKARVLKLSGSDHYPLLAELSI